MTWAGTHIKGVTREPLSRYYREYWKMSVSCSAKTNYMHCTGKQMLWHIWLSSHTILALLFWGNALFLPTFSLTNKRGGCWLNNHGCGKTSSCTNATSLSVLSSPVHSNQSTGCPLGLVLLAQTGGSIKITVPLFPHVPHLRFKGISLLYCCHSQIHDYMKWNLVSPWILGILWRIYQQG